MPRRRDILAGIAASGAFLTYPVRAEEVVDLEWDDLLPEKQNAIPRSLRGIMEHEDAPLASQQPASTGTVSDWNGRTVRLSGYVVPLEYKGTGVTAFMLVPYVGACIHVPPPPANQLVFVTSERPYELEGMFEAVTVTGMFGTASTATQLAEPLRHFSDGIAPLCDLRYRVALGFLPVIRGA